MKKSLALLALTGLFSLVLAACAGNKDHNDADIAFAQQMVPHHEQAVDMADLALEKSENGQLLALAAQIKGAQAPEIDVMETWLGEWDAELAAHGDMAHGQDDEGMMTSREMKVLEAAAGEEFDKTWLELMIKHHEGAVTTAETEIGAGKSPKAKGLAKEIIDGQQAEIATMKGMLDS